MGSFFDRVYKKSVIQIDGGIMADALKKREEDFAKQHLALAVAAVGFVEGAMTTHVNTLRAYRKSEREQAKRVKDMDRAARYFSATGNPLPFYKAAGLLHLGITFCRSLNIEVPKDDSDLWAVPEDFKTETPEVTD